MVRPEQKSILSGLQVAWHCDITRSFLTTKAAFFSSFANSADKSLTRLSRFTYSVFKAEKENGYDTEVKLHHPLRKVIERETFPDNAPVLQLEKNCKKEKPERQEQKGMGEKEAS